MMHLICIFVIPFISDSYFILRWLNGKFLSWLGVGPVRIKLKTRKMNGQSSFDNKLNTTNMSRSHYSFIVFCQEQSSKSASEASALYHLENTDTTGL